MSAILILEDDYDIAVVWRRALEKNGHRVDVSLTSSEAVAYSDFYAYDLFIVDLLISNDANVVRDSGRKFLQHLRIDAKRTISSDRFIGVTGFKPLQRENAAKSIFSLYGVKNVLFKPFGASELVELVETLLAAS